jgi:hypothetical protein
MIGWTFSLRRLENRMSPLKEESRKGGEQPETLRSRRASSSAAAIERSLGLRISSSDRHGKECSIESPEGLRDRGVEWRWEAKLLSCSQNGIRRATVPIELFECM